MTKAERFESGLGKSITMGLQLDGAGAELEEPGHDGRLASSLAVKS